MGLSLETLIHLTTPQYLIIGIISPIASYLITNMDFPGMDIITIILSLSFGILGFNAFNQLSDIEIDKIDKPLRPLISEKVNKKQVIYLTIAFYFASLVLAFFSNFLFFILMLIFTLTTYLYCSKNIYFKKYFWGSSFVGTIIYGIIPFLAAVSISNKQFNIIFLIFFGIMFTVISNTKDFEDMSGEKKYNINSVPLILGADKASVLIVISEIIIIISIGLLSFLNYIDALFMFSTAISLFLLSGMSYLFLKDIKRIKYKNIAFSETNNIEIKSVITQSDAPTISIIFILLVELIFGLTALTIG